MEVVRAALNQGDEVKAGMLSGIQPVIVRGTPLTDADRTADLCRAARRATSCGTRPPAIRPPS